MMRTKLSLLIKNLFLVVIFAGLLFQDAILASPEEKQLILASDTVINLIAIPSGKFVMGAESPLPDEWPAHKVKLSKPLLVASTPVTQAQYYAIMGENPSFYKVLNDSGELLSGNHPVESISWYEALNYCNALSLKFGYDTCYSSADGNQIIAEGQKVIFDTSANGFRLPTEAEWEYLCRAGTNTAFFWGDSDDISVARQFSWFSCDWLTTDEVNEDDISKNPESTQPVGKLLPNNFGLFDMCGNVAEMCWDVWQKSYVRNEVTDPINSSDSIARVIRGGSWATGLTALRSSGRFLFIPRKSNANSSVGFRIVRNN